MACWGWFSTVWPKIYSRLAEVSPLEIKSREIIPKEVTYWGSIQEPWWVYCRNFSLQSITASLSKQFEIRFNSHLWRKQKKSKKTKRAEQQTICVNLQRTSWLVLALFIHFHQGRASRGERCLLRFRGCSPFSRYQSYWFPLTWSTWTSLHILLSRDLRWRRQGGT